MINRKDVELVNEVDQLLDYYELTNKQFPEQLSVTQATYDALRNYVIQDKGCMVMQLTHYRKVPIKVVKANSKQ